MLRAMGIALLLLPGCSEWKAADAKVQRLAAAAAPYVSAFVRFEQWAQRAHGGVFDPREHAVIGETMFAPIRHEQGILAALVVRQQRRELRWVLPKEASFPHPVEWTRVRQSPHGSFDVAAWEQCPLGLPSWWRKDVSRRCVLLSRSARLSVGDTLTVVVAFTVGP